MKRPENIDIWDGVELTRDDTLTEKEKTDTIQRVLEEARVSAERFKAGQQTGMKHKE